MPTSMRALAFLGAGKAGVIDKAIPTPGPNDAVVRTTSALICTSDVHTVHGGIPIPDGRVLGHEAVGVIHELGSAVSGLDTGARVAVGAATPCFRCGPCQRGVSSQCRGMLGAYKFTAQRDGSMAEYFLVNDAEANLAVIPDDLPDEKAVYATDMLSTGFAGAENTGLRLGDTVAIFAQGPVGLSATIGCRLLGAAMIIAVESRPERQDLARRFGANVVVDPAAEDVVARILELTGGVGVDAAVEAIGLPETFEAAIEVTKPGGRISNIGYHGTSPEPLRIPLEPFGLGMSDKKILTALCPGGRDRLEGIFALMRYGRVDPTPMTTHTFGFDDVEHAFTLMQTKQDNIIKPLIRFK